MTRGIVGFVEISKSAHLSLAICLFFRYCVFAKIQKRRNDYDESTSGETVPALLRQFETKPQFIQDLNDEVERIHRELSLRLAKEDRKLLLRLADMEDNLRGHVTLHSFTYGYRLACGIHKEITEEPPYPFAREEEERACRKKAQAQDKDGAGDATPNQ